MSTFEAILIDPHAKTCTRTQIDPSEGQLQAYYKAIFPPDNPGLIDIISLPLNHALIIDDEGLLSQGQAFFMLEGITSPIGGKALMVKLHNPGHEDEHPISLSSFMTGEHMLQHVNFLGNANDLDKLIKLGMFQRPSTKINGETIWEWRP